MPFEQEFTKILSMMQVSIGKKVLTADNKQGYISDIYAVDMFIVTTANEVGDESTTKYKIGGEYIYIYPIQVPEIGDITPYGLVKGVMLLSKGIYRVDFNDSHKASYTLWLDFDRAVHNRPDGYKPLEFEGWVNPKHIEAYLEHYDLTRRGSRIVPKGLQRDDEVESHLLVELPNHDFECWDAEVDCNGMIDSVETCDGEVITTLEELREKDLLQVSLVSRFKITDY